MPVNKTIEQAERRLSRTNKNKSGGCRMKPYLVSQFRVDTRITTTFIWYDKPGRMAAWISTVGRPSLKRIMWWVRNGVNPVDYDEVLPSPFSGYAKDYYPKKAADQPVPENAQIVSNALMRSLADKQKLSLADRKERKQFIKLRKWVKSWLPREFRLDEFMAWLHAAE